MSRPQQAAPAKLVVGLFTADRPLLVPAAGLLMKEFGPVDMVSRWYPFHHTLYYEPEMGGPLFRRFLVFSRLICQSHLSGVKLTTNEVESVFSLAQSRRVNIDPGCLSAERFVLATGKNSAHRIYLGKGIYADLTLLYQGGQYRPLPWTYPDYGEEGIRSFLQQVRQRYLDSLRFMREAGTRETQGATSAVGKRGEVI